MRGEYEGLEPNLRSRKLSRRPKEEEDPRGERPDRSDGFEPHDSSSVKDVVFWK